jgi:hypothetical protein
MTSKYFAADLSVDHAGSFRLTIVREPDLSLDVLCNQNLERKVKGGAGSSQHERGASLWVAED